jgi:hypothetical protein
MSFKVTISDISTTFTQSIESVVCTVDTPNDANARSSDVDNTIQIVGRIGTAEPTVDLYLWSLLPTNDTKAYRTLEVQITGAQGQLLRTVTFPNSFVVDYSESYSSYDGQGSFYLLLKQKKDRNQQVKVVGDLAAGFDD